MSEYYTQKAGLSLSLRKRKKEKHNIYLTVYIVGK